MAAICSRRDEEWRELQVLRQRTRQVQASENRDRDRDRENEELDSDTSSESENGDVVDFDGTDMEQDLSPGQPLMPQYEEWAGEHDHMVDDSNVGQEAWQGDGERERTFDVGEEAESSACWNQDVMPQLTALSPPGISDTSEAPITRAIFTSAQNCFVERFYPDAGVPKGAGVLDFEHQHDLDLVSGHNEFGPFMDRETLEICKWLMRPGSTSEGRDIWFKLSAIQRKLQLPWMNDESFLRNVDRLPRGPKWMCHTITIEGDNSEQGGRRRTEEYDLWFRDIIDCIRELIGNPSFKDVMHFVPEKHFQDADRRVPIYDKMWTGEWWWETQRLIPEGSAIGALIIASDKTQLTKLSGDKEAWPVYLSLGNISKEARRKVSKHATILLAYIPIAKLKCFRTKARRQKEKWDFFHMCMKEVFRPLAELGGRAISMTCCDGLVRDMIPIIAAYIADHPEQCLVSCSRENRCPGCRVQPSTRNMLDRSLSREPLETLATIRAAISGRGDDLLDSLGLRPTWPFWSRFPHHFTNVHTWFWPDIRHQLTKGMLEHLKDWVVALAGTDDIDSRCETLTKYPGLKHFSKGLSDVWQWTGNEFKDLLRILVVISVHAIPDQALKCVRVFADFQFLASLHRHTEATIQVMGNRLAHFHEYRQVFQELGAIGALDGTNSEGPECLHIDFAKVVYHAVKKTDYIRFMTIWLDRQEALNRQESYLNWVQQLEGGITAPLEVSDVEEEDLNDQPSTHTHDVHADETFISAGSRRYLIAKRPSLKPKFKLHPSEINRIFGVFDFIAAVNNFLLRLTHRQPTSQLSVSEHDIFLCWSRFRIYHSTIYEFGTSHEHDQVRALPKPTLGSVDGIFDTVLVYTFPTQQFPHCYQIAQVRAIFMFPPDVLELQDLHFAYVELFTKFPAQPHAASGLYPVSRLATSGGMPVAKIVPITDIHYSCHLTGKIRHASEISWTSQQSLNKCQTFYLNIYCSRRLWALSMGFMNVE